MPLKIYPGIVGRLRQLCLSLDINPEHLGRMPGDSEGRTQQTFPKASNLEHLSKLINTTRCRLSINHIRRPHDRPKPRCSCRTMSVRIGARDHQNVMARCSQGVSSEHLQISCVYRSPRSSFRISCSSQVIILQIGSYDWTSDCLLVLL